MNKTPKTQFEKVYVNVNLDSDSAGFIHPRSIQMEDGKIYIIDSVKEYHRANEQNKMTADCYSLIVNGIECHLFCEKTGDLFHNSLGRWFVAKKKMIS